MKGQGFMVLAVINNKGGTGKTTSAVSLSAALALKGLRVLLVDLDAQASASLFPARQVSFMQRQTSPRVTTV